jgi:hypothetical protein
MSNYKDEQKLSLEKLINDKNVEQTTETIRELRHSKKIKDEVQRIIELKRKYTRLNKETLSNMAVRQCNFLFKNYTNIFNRVLEDQLDLNILGAFLEVLKRIEDGKIDQHQGSFEIGNLLKQLYIDSALRKDKDPNKDKVKKYKKVKNTMSWKQFKESQLNQNQ